MPLPSSRHASPLAAASASEPLADRLADFLARVSPGGDILFVSPGGVDWLGLPAASALKGRSLLEHVAPEGHAALRAALESAREGGRKALGLRMRRGEKGWFTTTCRIVPLIAVGKHVELLFAAWECVLPFTPGDEAADARDELTGLANRGLLLRRLAESIAAADADHAGFALLHLGLDGFKKVNDALGHMAGDRLLKEAGLRLKTLLRAADTVARTGGDEFGLLLSGSHAQEDVFKVARKLLGAMQRPFVHGNGHLHLSASIGIALYPEHAGDAETLFKHADIALSMAKQSGRNRCHLYVPEGGELVERRFMLEEHMYDAVQNGEFEMHYQPIFRADDRAMVGVEALMRWNRPGLGFVPPGEFIPLAEANGLIGFLGAWSLRASCHQVARWNKAWGARLRASVNLSPVQFRQGDLVAEVKSALAESGLAAECLSLELTEGVLMYEPERAQELLTLLRDHGVSFAVDDFGTGYSSLAYLKRFPLACLKIDRSFVSDLTRDTNDRAIVSAILSLARELGLRVIAEGVEEEAQLCMLKDKGCDFVQGYLLGRPVAPDEFAGKVEDGEWRLMK